MPLKDGEETVRRVETMSTVARADETAPHVLLAEEDATDDESGKHIQPNKQPTYGGAARAVRRHIQGDRVVERRRARALQLRTSPRGRPVGILPGQLTNH